VRNLITLQISPKTFEDSWRKMLRSHSLFPDEVLAQDPQAQGCPQLIPNQMICQKLKEKQHEELSHPRPRLSGGRKLPKLMAPE